MACESIYWTNINDDIEKTVTNCSTCLDFQQTQLKEKIICHEIPAKPWEIVSADMFTLHKGNYFYIVDFYSKFLVIKKTEDLSADCLTLPYKIFLEYCLPKKIM